MQSFLELELELLLLWIMAVITGSGLARSASPSCGFFCQCKAQHAAGSGSALLCSSESFLSFPTAAQRAGGLIRLSFDPFHYSVVMANLPILFV
jgi:hypothetical protein